MQKDLKALLRFKGNFSEEIKIEMYILWLNTRLIADYTARTNPDKLLILLHNPSLTQDYLEVSLSPSGLIQFLSNCPTRLKYLNTLSLARQGLSVWDWQSNWSELQWGLIVETYLAATLLAPLTQRFNVINLLTEIYLDDYLTHADYYH
jgi:hypothetical protein